MRKAFLQLHVAVLLAGFTAILGKLILLNEGLLVWYRIFLTVMVLGIWMYFKKQIQHVNAKDRWRIAGVGLIIALHWVAFYGSVKYANVSVALVCFSATGFFTALLEPLILRKKMEWRELGLGIIAISGIYVIFDFHRLWLVADNGYLMYRTRLRPTVNSPSKNFCFHFQPHVQFRAGVRDHTRICIFW